MKKGNLVDIKALYKDSQPSVAALFSSAFASSEGNDEGELVGALASKLCSNIDNDEIVCFGAFESHALAACIFFTRLRFKQPILVYMLAPVAVSVEYQKQGLGSALIRYGLNEMKKRSVTVTITYGDPAFYTRLGFQALSENVIRAPLTLSMPQGWLGQSLTKAPIPSIKERPRCVKEFDDPRYW